MCEEKYGDIADLNDPESPLWLFFDLMDTTAREYMERLDKEYESQQHYGIGSR